MPNDKDPNDKDPVKVKQLLEWAAARSVGATTDEAPPVDAETAAQLAKWFGLPSYQDLKEKGVEIPPPPEDADTIRFREQREKALAAIDPAMLEAHRKRVERCDGMIKFVPSIDVRVDPSVALLDLAMIERVGSIADPRQVELSEELQEDLRDCTPQALLRDLHRVETHFDKQFEIVDMAAEQRIDIVTMVAEAMKADWSLPELGPSPMVEGRALLAEIHAIRRSPWTDIRMPNRRPGLDEEPVRR